MIRNLKIQWSILCYENCNFTISLRTFTQIYGKRKISIQSGLSCFSRMFFAYFSIDYSGYSRSFCFFFIFILSLLSLEVRRVSCSNLSLTLFILLNIRNDAVEFIDLVKRANCSLDRRLWKFIAVDIAVFWWRYQSRGLREVTRQR